MIINFRDRMIGPAQLKVLKGFIPSLATYGVAAGTVVVYMASEWKGKDLLQFVPIYNRYFSTPNFSILHRLQ